MRRDKIYPDFKEGPLPTDEDGLGLWRGLMLGLSLSQTILLAAIFLILLLGGCASKFTEEDLALYAHRDYQIASQDEVLDAAQNVLRLADGEDVVFIRPAARGPVSIMEARRSWFYTTLVVSQWGKDRYSFIAEPLPPVGTRLTITANREWSTYVSWNNSDPLASPALLDLLHTRISYFLGLETVWRTCDGQRALGLPGDLNPLCDLTVFDAEPPI